MRKYIYTGHLGRGWAIEGGSAKGGKRRQRFAWVAVAGEQEERGRSSLEDNPGTPTWRESQQVTARAGSVGTVWREGGRTERRGWRGE